MHEALASSGARSTIDGRYPPESWSYPRSTYPREKTVAQLFCETAEQFAGRAAVVSPQGALTYRQLCGQAARLAFELREAGVGPDSLVAICAERSLEMITGIVAIILSGGAYVPLDPDYPRERLRLMLDQTGARVLLAQPHLLDRLANHPGRTLLLDPHVAGVECAEAPKVSGLTSESLAYVMFTSGSTGQPKGAMIPHRAIVRLVRNSNFMSLGPGEIFLQAAPISFDAATLEIWGPLLNGGTLALLPPGKLSLVELGRAIHSHGVTTLWLTAGLFQVMIEDHIGDLKNLRQLLAGGDVLPVQHVRKAISELPQVVLINGYGPTENTTFTCCHRVTRDDLERSSIPVGKPISNTSVHLLDDQMRPVPIGELGELFTGGDGLARGYLNSPELTAERFVPNPFVPGEKLYRTGDLCRWLPDGSIEFVGRKDLQVKIRGHRIELGEIEAVLSTHPHVKNACVIARGDTSAEKRLVAYVVPAGAAPAADELLSFLRERLPDFMVPAAVVTLEKFPLTPNGKVDRRALPEPPLRAAPSAPLASHESMGALEQAIATVWRELLGLPEVGLDENFFDLGGNSLLVAQAHVRLQRLLQREFPITDLFTHTTIRAIAAHFGADASGISNNDSVQERARRQRAVHAQRRVLQGHR